MAKSIENKIRFEAAIIYIIVALGVIALVVYLNNLRENISSRRIEIEKQQTLLSATNRLIFAMSEAQSSSSLYLTTKKKSALSDYIQSVDRTAKLIDTLVLLDPADREKLFRIENLLYLQAQNMAKLNLQFAKTNPVAVISERLQEYEPNQQLDTLIVAVRQDTVIGQPSRKRFFKRLGEVFKPHKDSVKIIVNQRVDTIRTSNRDSLGILTEMGDIAQKAQRVYTQNLKTIEKQVGELILSDKELAQEASVLLTELHQQTLAATLSVIDASEKAIRRNFLYSIGGGVLALILILIFIYLIIGDINKGRAARLALEEANERTRRIMESRHRLLLSVSHDIKSPLNSILGYLRMMKCDDRVRSMQHSSEHILSMLENLLEFSSLEQGTLRISRSDFSLRELCRDIYDMFLPLAGQKSLAFGFGADEVRIHADRVKIKQIIINLISNAVKYTLNGEVGFQAHFSAGELKIEVWDTGVGIPAEKLPQLFRPFSRIEENSALAEGSGLGMFVVKGLVDLLSGTIGVESEIGVGTRITVTIPTVRSSKEIPQGTKRIQVHDDDPAIVKMTSNLLLRLGHRIVNEQPDLILTDLEMGAVSGLDILHAAGEIPVVVMTGRADFSEQKARELGFDSFLPKPFTLESLREIVGDGDTANELLGDDRDAIMAIFRTSTAENYARLEQALACDDFPAARAVCHKMYPMFAQLGYPVEALRRMDAHRDGAYEGWRDDVRTILSVKV